MILICLHCALVVEADMPCARCAAAPKQLGLHTSGSRSPLDLVLNEAQFQPLPEATQTSLKTGPGGKYFVLLHERPIQVVGSEYRTVLPWQGSVSKRLINEKKDMTKLDGLARGVALFVVREEGSDAFLLDDDGHHRFVAALETQFPVVLLWSGAGGFSGTAWRDVKYGQF